LGDVGKFHRRRGAERHGRRCSDPRGSRIGDWGRWCLPGIGAGNSIAPAVAATTAPSRTGTSLAGGAGSNSGGARVCSISVPEANLMSFSANTL